MSVNRLHFLGFAWYTSVGVCLTWHGIENENCTKMVQNYYSVTQFNHGEGDKIHNINMLSTIF